MSIWTTFAPFYIRRLPCPFYAITLNTEFASVSFLGCFTTPVEVIVSHEHTHAPVTTHPQYTIGFSLDRYTALPVSTFQPTGPMRTDNG